MVAACSSGDPEVRDPDNGMSTPMVNPVGGSPPPTRPPPTMPPPVTTGGGGGTSAPLPAGDSGTGTGLDDEDAGSDELPPIVVCDEDDAGVPDVVDGCVVLGDVVVQYKAADVNPADQQIKPHFNIKNEGTQSVPLTELTLRYWFRAGGTSPAWVFWCDYAQIDCGKVNGQFVAVSGNAEADTYLEVSFINAGELAGGQQTGEIQTRFNQEGWPSLDETDDYSFDPAAGAFTETHRVTLYRRGTLIWGVEPK